MYLIYTNIKIQKYIKCMWKNICEYTKKIYKKEKV